MPISKEEAHLIVLEQIAAILTYATSEGSSTDEEADENYEQMLDLADIIAVALDFEVIEVLDDNEIKFSAKISSAGEFLKNIIGK
jgi:dsDNA-binding SOS-regulon protein